MLIVSLRLLLDLNHQIPAVPLNPSCDAITVHGKKYETVQSPTQLSNPRETSLWVLQYGDCLDIC